MSCLQTIYFVFLGPANIFFFNISNPRSRKIMVRPLLTKRGVKVAGYWPTSSRSIKTQKKELGQYPANLTSCLVNEAFIIWPKDYTKIAGTKRVIPSGQDRPILHARVAN